MNNSKVKEILSTFWPLGLVVIAAVVFFYIRQGRETNAKSFTTNLPEVNYFASKIADFTFPGYSYGAALNEGETITVLYTSMDGFKHVYLFQTPASEKLSEDEIIKRMHEGISLPDMPATFTEASAPFQTVFRDQPAALRTWQGTNPDGKTYRRYVLPFEGKGGQAMLSIEGATDSLSEAEVTSILGSFK